MTYRLKQNIKKQIRKNNQLLADIADELGVQSNTVVGPSLQRNAVGLMTLPVLRIISKHTGVPVDDLYEEVSTDTVAM